MSEIVFEEQKSNRADLFGDVVLESVNDEGQWFAFDNEEDQQAGSPGTRRKKKVRCSKTVFFSLKVKRLSDVDHVRQTYRMKFHMYLNWLPTFNEYQTYQNLLQEDRVYEFKPTWYPHLEFVNSVEEHSIKWVENVNEGKFKMKKFKKFAYDVDTNDSMIEPDSPRYKKGFSRIEGINNVEFIRAKLECDITFAELFELQNFPVDCQDLACEIQERTPGAKQITCKFLPELRKPNFAAVDPKYAVISEWSLVNTIIEVEKRSGRTEQSYETLVIRLKLERNWIVFFWRVVFIMFCVCFMDLTAYSLDYDSDMGERLSLIVTLVLTIVAFSIVVNDQIPNVPYVTFLETYILFCFAFSTFIMMQTALAPYYNLEDEDRRFFWFSFGFLWFFHLCFAGRAFVKRYYEKRKIHMTTKELDENEIEEQRHILNVNYDNSIYSNYDTDYLSFRAIPIKYPTLFEELAMSIFWLIGKLTSTCCCTDLSKSFCRKKKKIQL